MSTRKSLNKFSQQYCLMKYKDLFQKESKIMFNVACFWSIKESFNVPKNKNIKLVGGDFSSHVSLACYWDLFGSHFCCAFSLNLWPSSIEAGDTLPPICLLRCSCPVHKSCSCSQLYFPTLERLAFQPSINHCLSKYILLQ